MITPRAMEEEGRQRGSDGRPKPTVGAIVSKWKSTPERYGRVAAGIHWGSALLLVALLASGFRAASTLDPATKAVILRVHAVLGLSILALTLARVGWWFIDAKPAMAVGTRPFLSRAAKIVHALFYVVILGMAASGIGTMVLSGAGALLFGGAAGTLPEFWAYPPRVPHGIGARVLVALVILHSGAALYHQFIRRDGLLRRMAFS